MLSAAALKLLSRSFSAFARFEFGKELAKVLRFSDESIYLFLRLISIRWLVEEIGSVGEKLFV